ncbi:pilus assembly PilX family protein [Lysobacter humi (ex Lee et al. 2017)]
MTRYRTDRRRQRPAPRVAHERGAALVVVLLLLLVVTLLGLAGIRGALLQERMAANAVARSYAFQAAEAVLREAEDVVTQTWQANPNWEPNAQAFTSGTTANDITSQYTVTLLGPAANSGGAGAGGTSSADNPDLKERIESTEDRTTSKVYRVLVTSTNADNGVQVQLESLYELSKE